MGDYFTYNLSSGTMTVGYVGLDNPPAWMDGKLALTNLRDTYGEWLVDFNTGTYNDHYNWFDYATIYVNKDYDTSSYIDSDYKQKTLAHELGHVLQLGHPTPVYLPSVMYVGDIDNSVSMTPTAKDRSDLISIYN